MDREEAARLLVDRRRDLEEVRSAALREAGPAPGEQELSSYDQHPADAATDTVDREQNMSMVEMAGGSLRELDDAVRRLDEGTYGLCEVCGAAIPDDRLRAAPGDAFLREARGGGERARHLILRARKARAL